jgi:hypothetical protein
MQNVGTPRKRAAARSLAADDAEDTEAEAAAAEDGPSSPVVDEAAEGRGALQAAWQATAIEVRHDRRRRVRREQLEGGHGSSSSHFVVVVMVDSHPDLPDAGRRVAIRKVGRQASSKR